MPRRVSRRPRRSRRNSRRRSRSRGTQLSKSKKRNQSRPRSPKRATFRGNTPPPTPRDDTERITPRRYMEAAAAEEDSHPLPLPNMLQERHLSVPMNVNLAQHFTDIAGIKAGEWFIREKLTGFVTMNLERNMPENLSVYPCEKEYQPAMLMKLRTIDTEQKNACGYLVHLEGNFDGIKTEPHVVFYTYVSAPPQVGKPAGTITIYDSNSPREDDFMTVCRLFFNTTVVRASDKWIASFNVRDISVDGDNPHNKQLRHFLPNISPDVGTPGYCGVIALMFHAHYLLSLDIGSFERWMGSILPFIGSIHEDAGQITELQKAEKQVAMLIHLQAFSGWLVEGILRSFLEMKPIFEQWKQGESPPKDLNKFTLYNALASMLVDDSQMGEYMRTLAQGGSPTRVHVRRIQTNHRVVYAHVEPDGETYKINGPVIMFDYIRSTCETKSNRTMDNVSAFLAGS